MKRVFYPLLNPNRSQECKSAALMISFTSANPLVPPPPLPEVKLKFPPS